MMRLSQRLQMFGEFTSWWTRSDSRDGSCGRGEGCLWVLPTSSRTSFANPTGVGNATSSSISFLPRSSRSRFRLIWNSCELKEYGSWTNWYTLTINGIIWIFINSMWRSDSLRMMSNHIYLRFYRDTTCPLDEALSDMALGKVPNIFPNPCKNELNNLRDEYGEWCTKYNVAMRVEYSQIFYIFCTMWTMKLQICTRRAQLFWWV